MVFRLGRTLIQPSASLVPVVLLARLGRDRAGLAVGVTGTTIDTWLSAADGESAPLGSALAQEFRTIEVR